MYNFSHWRLKENFKGLFLWRIIVHNFSTLSIIVHNCPLCFLIFPSQFKLIKKERNATAEAIVEEKTKKSNNFPLKDPQTSGDLFSLLIHNAAMTLCPSTHRDIFLTNLFFLRSLIWCKITIIWPVSTCFPKVNGKQQQPLLLILEKN